jgi:hypothetical protein
MISDTIGVIVLWLILALFLYIGQGFDPIQ